MENKKKLDVGRKAWHLIRLAVIWARKNAEPRRTFAMDVRKYFFRRSKSGAAAIGYGERQMSFHSTPMIHVKMHRAPPLVCFNIPCIKPNNVLDHHNYDHDDLDQYDHHDDGYSIYGYDDDDDVDVDEDVDQRAEMFITKFYEQTKVQRQSCY